MLTELDFDTTTQSIDFSASMDEVVVIDNYVPNSIQVHIWNIINSHAWQFGHTTKGTWNPWNYERSMAEIPALKQDIFPAHSPIANDSVWHIMHGLITDLLPQKTRCISILVNGQQYIHDSLVHTDNDNLDGITVLYYANPTWREEWKGHTEIQTPNKTYNVLPQPGRLCIFNAHIPHKGHSPTDLFKSLRVSVAFRLYIEK